MSIAAIVSIYTVAHRAADQCHNATRSIYRQQLGATTTLLYVHGTILDTEHAALRLTNCQINYRNLSTHIDLHTHAGSPFDNRVTLTFDLLTSG